MKRPFLKQKLALYFDENVPAAVVFYFSRDRFWKKKVRVASAHNAGTVGHPDVSHHAHCQRHRYTLVTLDRDFDDDQRFPFTNGKSAGIIMIEASSAEVDAIVDILSRVLRFLVSLPFPKSFLLETKFIAGRDNVVIRGRNASTKEVKAISVTAGATTIQEIREFFNF
jgi:predicted nuclease of predicted toxin-antitoxin system